MDVNGTRYHLLLGRDDWAACLDERQGILGADWWASPVEHNDSGLAWRDATHELTLQSRIYQFDTSPFDDRLSLDRRRGAGRDGYGNWYWIAESGTELRVQSAGTGRSAHFWAAGDGQACETSRPFGGFGPKEPPAASGPLPLSGLAVTHDHYLVVGVLRPKGLLIFDLHATGAPRQMLWPDSVSFEPFDMAPRPGGGVWILDRANRCYWGLDRKLNVFRLDQAAEARVADEFQPLGGGGRQSAARPFPQAIALAAASPIAAHDPIAIDALPDGSVLFLDNVAGESFSRLLRYQWDQQLGEASLEAVSQVVDPRGAAGFRLIGYDLAFLPANDPAEPARLGQVFVAAFNGNQTYAFDLFGAGPGLELQALADFYPMRLFGGKAIVTAGDQVYYDFGESWLPLVAQKRPRYVPDAAFYTFWFDGKQPDCVWHRLMVDACLPPACGLEIWSRSANELDGREQATWQPEPRPVRRAAGSELPFTPRLAAEDAGTWELLFQSAAGRYLQLKVRLSGDGRSTPRLRALRAYYPRFSYLEHYLPAVYQEDQASASFLDRFLANNEGTLTALEDEIANVQMLFDVRSVPAEALEWLANWLGVALDPVWDELRRRLFIQYALQFFQYRGTVRGILLALHLAFDPCVDPAVFTQPLVFGARQATADRRLTAYRVIEKFRARQTPPPATLAAANASGLRSVVVMQQWSPDQGRDALLQGWRANTATVADFAPQSPGGAQTAAWQSFARTRLGFVPTVDATLDADTWHEFLSNRYGTIGALNSAYGLPVPSRYRAFEDVSLPATMPRDGAQLLDWYEFAGTVLPMQRAAHRFSVLLPAPAYLTDAQRQERIEIAQRIVDLEKPAHTTFEVKFYWAMFRIGEAQLGQDTLIDVGSRAPDLMPAFVLGRDYLSEGYLAPGHPQDVPDRLVLDRDRLTGEANSSHHL